MKKNIILFISALVLSCGNKENKDESTKENEKTKNTPESSVVSEEVNLCFINDSEKCEDGKIECTMNLTIDSEKVIGEYSCVGCGGNGNGDYSGIKKGDTLFLEETFESPDGSIETFKTIWLLSEKNIRQLETEEKNGKTSIKKNGTIIFTYYKRDC